MIDDLPEAPGEPGPGLDRRRFLRAAGVSTATIWAAPAIVSISPAFAQASPGPGDDQDDQDDRDDEQDDQDDDQDDQDDQDDEQDDQDDDQDDQDDEQDVRTDPPDVRGEIEVEVPVTEAEPISEPISVREPNPPTGRPASRVIASEELPRSGASTGAMLGAGTAAMAAGAAVLGSHRPDPAPTDQPQTTPGRVWTATQHPPGSTVVPRTEEAGRDAAEDAAPGSA